MNRVGFMQQLERLLADIPESDRLDAIAYYNDYFDEAGPENEASVIRELGSPGRVAAMIKADLHRSSDGEGNNRAEGGSSQEGASGVTVENGVSTEKVKQKKKFPWPLIIVLLVFASPVLVSVAGSLFGGLLGILGGLLGIIVGVIVCGVALTVSGIVLLVVGVVRIAISPVEGLVTIGVGSILLAVGLLFALLFVWGAFKWIPALFRGCVNLYQKVFLRKEGGNKV